MMAITINKLPENIQEQIINDYKNGKSMRQIEKDYDVSRATVAKFLEKIGIKTTKGNHHRTYHHNEEYFESIDTEHKAYWLGFIFADGYIINHDAFYGQDQMGISIDVKDVELLEQFKKDICSTNPIQTYKHSGKGCDMCRIHLTSQKTVNDLINKGCEKQKSHILKPPKNIPDHLLRHFIRGYFDGDGSITKSKNEHYKKTNGYVYGINITTTKEMSEWLYSFFDMGSVVKENRREFTWYYSLGGHNQVINFYHILYDNSTISLERKKYRFEELLEKYPEREGM